MNSKTGMHDEVLAGIDPRELEEEVPESRFRPYVVAGVGILLLVLMVSWVFADFLQSRVESRPLDARVLDFGDVRVVFENETLRALQDEFVQNQHREIKACLFGKVLDDDYILEGISFPEIIRASVVHIVSVPCPEEAIIDVHSHPVDQCLASEQDVSVLQELQGKNPVMRMLVMCGQDRFARI